MPSLKKFVANIKKILKKVSSTLALYSNIGISSISSPNNKSSLSSLLFISEFLSLLLCLIWIFSSFNNISWFSIFL